MSPAVEAEAIFTQQDLLIGSHIVLISRQHYDLAHRPGDPENLVEMLELAGSVQQFPPEVFQHSFFKLRSHTKIVLFHEGTNDFSRIKWPIKRKINQIVLKLILFPYRYKPVPRSNTDYYQYYYTPMPELIEKRHQFEVIQISTEFFKSIFYKKISPDIELVPGSIFICLSAKDWINDKKLRKYFSLFIHKLNELNLHSYMKLAPAQNANEYHEFLQDFNNVSLIMDNTVNSESYIFHLNLRYIISDESSAVINAIFSGARKTFFFVNKEIKSVRLYPYNRVNYLIDFLNNKNVIIQETISDITQKISKGYESHYKLDFFNREKELKISNLIKDSKNLN